MNERLETLQAELEQVKEFKCLSFDLKRKLVDYYEHEIEAIQFANELWR